jgi:hypothetical protein
MSGVERALFYLNFIAQLVLLFRLLHFKLYRVYLSLFLYWLLQALPSVALMAISVDSRRYSYVYWGAQTINVLMAVFVVQDVYRIALLEHPAVASFARRTVLAAMAIAAMVTLSGITLDSTILAGQSPAVHRFATFERSMNFVILLFLLLISVLLLWFPIRVRRNIVVYISGFVLFSASRSFGLLLANILPASDTRLVSTVLLALTLVCLTIWIVGIQPEGELVIATPGYRRNPETMQRLSQQLDSINAALTRFVRH